MSNLLFRYQPYEELDYFVEIYESVYENTHLVELVVRETNGIQNGTQISFLDVLATGDTIGDVFLDALESGHDIYLKVDIVDCEKALYLQYPTTFTDFQKKHLLISHDYYHALAKLYGVVE